MAKGLFLFWKAVIKGDMMLWLVHPNHSWSARPESKVLLVPSAHRTPGSEVSHVWLGGELLKTKIT